MSALLRVEELRFRLRDGHAAVPRTPPAPIPWYMSLAADLTRPQRAASQRTQVLVADDDPSMRAASQRTQVLVADDDPSMRAALADLIGDDDDLELVAAVGTVDAAIASASRQHPDVALLDVRMPVGDGTRAAHGIAQVSPRTRMLALSAYGDRATVIDMLRAGATGYLVKGAPAQEILTAIKRCARGQCPLSGEVAGDVVAELAQRLARQERDKTAHRDVRLEVERVIAEARLAMVFQPIVELASGRVVGVEALARFPGSDLGPATWFARAAEVGLAAELELTAVRVALADLDALDPEVFLAVNVSPDVAASAELATTLAASDPRRIVLEVTEHAPVDDYAGLQRALDPLRHAGLRLAIDDAGAGYASLRHIVKLAPDVIKVDVSLTRRIDTDRVQRALTAALTSFAAQTGTGIVAEGIETPSQLRALRDLGVRCGQGYLLARPAPLEDLGRGPRR
jgi:EAL domain-containing protein (putative c-di-GMP-specific phosphodiesterase class I)